jgi:hypothetical protein
MVTILFRRTGFVYTCTVGNMSLEEENEAGLSNGGTSSGDASGIEVVLEGAELVAEDDTSFVVW